MIQNSLKMAILRIKIDLLLGLEYSILMIHIIIWQRKQLIFICRIQEDGLNNFREVVA